MSTHAFRGQQGFTIIELLLAMLIMVGITSAIFGLVDPSRGTYRQQPEVSDMQQRLRVGTSYLSNDLVMAGAGAPAGGSLLGSLMNYFAPIQPLRLGMIDSDLEAGVLFREDAITIMFIPPNAPHTTVHDPMPQPSSEHKVDPQPNCAVGDPLCGFFRGQRAVIFDETGAYDDFTITWVQPEAQLGHLQHNKMVPGNEFSKKYQPGAQIAQIQQRTYYLNAATNQLMAYDGDQRDEAVVDNVVDLRFEYFGEPRPPLIMDPTARTTTYGPRPPALGVIPAGKDTWSWGAGANCIFSVDPGTGTWAPRLPDLAPNSQALILMAEDMLTDGPFCPDADYPTRFDADLLRIRKIGIVVRVQVAAAELRGPSATLFRNPRRGFSNRTMVPDQELRFEITPRNFNLGR